MSLHASAIWVNRLASFADRISSCPTLRSPAVLIRQGNGGSSRRDKRVVRQSIKRVTANPVQAWQVLGPSTVESRFEAQRGAVLTPLVGREEELELLRRSWQQAKAGLHASSV
jgi:hypothetical protein